MPVVVPVVVDCKADPNGQMFCNCTINGSFAGNCQGSSGPEACDLSFGCCSQFW